MPDQNDLDRKSIAALVLWTGVGAVGIVLTGRATSGAFDEPASAVIPILATLIALAGSLGAWTLFHFDGRRGDAARRLFDGLLSLLPACLVGFATALNAAPVTLAAVMCLLALGLAFVAVREGMRITSIGATHAESEVDVDVRIATASVVSNDQSDEESPLPAVDLPVLHRTESPASQQISRRRTDDGGEEIEAELLATFDPHERQAILHLPIHPVLQSVPHVECEPLDDASVTVRVTDVHAYGVRIEVRRSEELARAVGVPIGILVQVAAAADSAA